MSTTLMSQKNIFLKEKTCFWTKIGLIKVGLMSIKYPNKERQPLVNSFFTVFKDNSYPMIRN